MGRFFWMLRFDTNIDGSRAGCCMVRFKCYESKGVGYIPKCDPDQAKGVDKRHHIQAVYTKK